MKSLATQAALATICVCSYKHNSSWVASHIHACTNETHSLANLQDLIPTLALVVRVAYNYAANFVIPTSFLNF